MLRKPGTLLTGSTETNLTSPMGLPIGRYGTQKGEREKSSGTQQKPFNPKDWNLQLLLL